DQCCFEGFPPQDKSVSVSVSAALASLRASAVATKERRHERQGFPKGRICPCALALLTATNHFLVKTPTSEGW
ncbi:MAG: hypothetical protein PUP93_31420, partial [Rhizonema sp. NSF051]|nr:hypothetical protein [Rhizonema sp. NSF051]